MCGVVCVWYIVWGCIVCLCVVLCVCVHASVCVCMCMRIVYSVEHNVA